MAGWALLLLLAGQAATSSAPVTVGEMEVPHDRGAQKVLVQTREFAPGATSGWHVHAGVEIAYLVSGDMELMTAGGVRRLKPGDSFVMPRGHAHNGVNPGTEPARMVITLIVDLDAPLRSSVPAP